MKQVLRNVFVTATIVFLLVPATGIAQGVGPAIGTEIKDFSLSDQSGEKQRLSELLKLGPAAIVFHRSADW